MKKLLLALFILVLATLGLFELNGNFSVANITLTTWPKNEKLEPNTPLEIAQAKTILNQPFTYLGQGRQSFIFASQDDKYVLKFMKCQRINPACWYEFFAESSTIRQERFTRLAKSMTLAKSPMHEQTGVLLLHVYPSNELQSQVHLIDKLGLSHTVDIDKCPFVLQRKAKPAFATLKALYKENKTHELEARLQQLLDLFVERASFGITNPDGKLIGHNNVGFLDNRAVYIDIGTLRQSPKSVSPTYLVKDFKRLDPIVEWLQANDPVLAKTFTNNIKAAQQKILSQPVKVAGVDL